MTGGTWPAGSRLLAKGKEGDGKLRIPGLYELGSAEHLQGANGSLKSTFCIFYINAPEVVQWQPIANR